MITHNRMASPPPKILVVDDDPDVRNFLSESLAILGFHGVIVENGASALTELDHINPDAMILDFAMPGMNGAEVARKAREHRPGLPIIFASGYSETAAVKAVLGEHSRLLQKPFKVHELQSALHELLAGRRNFE
jgi:CheY-like chemotaxis protein